jgi:transcriptional regulator with XRE-family HTH domain
MTAPLTKTVAAEVRAELSRQNVSTATAAAALGISRQALWSRMRGYTPFTIADLESLADLLGVPAARFLERAA